MGQAPFVHNSVWSSGPIAQTASDDYPEFVGEATNFPTVEAHYSVPKATGIQDKAHAHIELPFRPKKGNLV